MAKVMVSFPDDLLAALDAEVRRRATTRSAVLQEATRRALARRDPDDIAEAIARSTRRFDAAGDFEAADLIRQDRDARA